ncbi:MAG: hypothetical protein GWO02_05175 [Gammaproteobacteria bacterium]|nr:hypothetical protein [Gammaproteobacteria bacterium]
MPIRLQPGARSGLISRPDAPVIPFASTRAPALREFQRGPARRQSLDRNRVIARGGRLFGLRPAAGRGQGLEVVDIGIDPAAFRGKPSEVVPILEGGRDRQLALDVLAKVKATNPRIGRRLTPERVLGARQFLSAEHLGRKVSTPGKGERPRLLGTQVARSRLTAGREGPFKRFEGAPPELRRAADAVFAAGIEAGLDDDVIENALDDPRVLGRSFGRDESFGVQDVFERIAGVGGVLAGPFAAASAGFGPIATATGATAAGAGAVEAGTGAIATTGAPASAKLASAITALKKARPLVRAGAAAAKGVRAVRSAREGARRARERTEGLEALEFQRGELGGIPVAGGPSGAIQTRAPAPRANSTDLVVAGALAAAALLAAR